MTMKKYFFVSFKAFNGKGEVGVGGLVVVCSCDHKRMVEALLEYYNKHAEHKADKIVTTALTFLDKQTAAQLSNNFTDNALIIDDSEKEEEKQEVEVGLFLARDKDNSLFLYVDNNEPKKGSDYWTCDDGDCMEIDSSLFTEVKWSDEEPTKVKLVIDK